MTDSEIIKSVALWITPFLVGVIGFFVRSAFKKSEESTDQLRVTVTALDKDFIGIKKDIQMLSEMLGSIRHIRDEWYAMKQEVGQVVLEMKNLKSSLEDVVVLKRDQATIWKRIDELREDLKEGRKQ